MKPHRPRISTTLARRALGRPSCARALALAALRVAIPALRVAFAALRVAIAAWMAGTAWAAEDAAGTERQLGAVVDELNALDVWLDDAGKRMTGLQGELARADRDVAATGRRIHDLDAELAATRATLEALARERVALEERRFEQARRVAQHVRAAYRHSGGDAGGDFFKVLLNQSDPTEFGRMLRYHGYFSRARLDAVAEFRQMLANLADNEDATRGRRAALAEQQGELEERLTSLVARREDRETVIAALATEVSDRESRRRGLALDRERLEALLKELRRRAREAEATQFAENKGRLSWPVAGRIVRRFGQPRAGGRLRWEGVYFEAREGAEVTAIHGGRVVFADWLRGFGLLAIIDHGDGHMSLYGNADVLLKEVGDWVEGGEPIAAAGRSGGQAESGLYLEVRANGQPTNPIAWLERNQATP